MNEEDKWLKALLNALKVGRCFFIAVQVVTVIVAIYMLIEHIRGAT